MYLPSARAGAGSLGLESEFPREVEKNDGAHRTTADVFDLGLALSSVGGDREFLTEVVGLIQAAWPTLLTNLRNGMARRDLSAVETTARLAKAAARNVSARKAYEVALQLETIAAKGEWQATQEAIANLEREVEILQFFLTTLANPACAP